MHKQNIRVKSSEKLQLLFYVYLNIKINVTDLIIG